jgi:hypothetical protein
MTDPEEPSFRARHRDPMSTGSFAVTPGNALFEAAVRAIGFDRDVVRLTLTSILNTIGAYADAMTPDELGIVLPEIDRRMRKLAPDDIVDAAMKRLQHVLLGWEEQPE